MEARQHSLDLILHADAADVNLCAPPELVLLLLFNDLLGWLAVIFIAPWRLANPAIPNPELFAEAFDIVEDFVKGMNSLHEGPYRLELPDIYHLLLLFLRDFRGLGINSRELHQDRGLAYSLVEPFLL